MNCNKHEKSLSVHKCKVKFEAIIQSNQFITVPVPIFPNPVKSHKTVCTNMRNFVGLLTANDIQNRK